MKDYCGVVVNNESIQLDRIFTYKIPENLREDIQIGCRVKVPFGMGNKKIDAFVLEFFDEFEGTARIKSIIELCDNIPLLSKNDIQLIKNMKERYLCTYLEAIRVFIPSGITKGVKEKTNLVLYTKNMLEEKYAKEPYISIFNSIKNREGIYNRSQLNTEFGYSLSSINTMIRNDFLEVSEQRVLRVDDRVYKHYKRRNLTGDQIKTINSILYSKDKMFLIHGVTGSGKTEIYMNLAENIISQEKQCIILVPEIALTPQMVERFKGRFGKNIAVFHSRLSQGERFDEWARIKNGEVNIAIGARSAVFLPFANLGLIVIDEEHESSYKSDSDPKYNAIEIAELKSILCGCKVVLGSATPSVETYYKFLKREYEIINLHKRVDGSSPPKIDIVDMREELLKNNKSIFSEELFLSIEDRLKKREQIILFLNRRGFSTFVSCRSCGHVFKCSNCDISLTYHMGSNYLSCHYCGDKSGAVKNCPTCGSKYVKYFGVGTEKVEEEVKKYFPGAKTLRMDFDTTRKKGSHEAIYNTFKNQEADILIGTQMIAKGLDFHNVTLVGVLAADLSLNLPDFRSNEKTYQLITQVAGRAGRGEKKGKVVVQTYNPDNFSIKFAKDNDYIWFLKEELKIRQIMNYPPFSKLLNINLSSEQEKNLVIKANELGVILKNMLKYNEDISVLGPCPCGVSKIKNFYRWQIIIKGDYDYKLAEKIKNTVYESLKDVYNNIKVGIDSNPYNIL